MSHNPMTEKLRKFRNHRDISTSEFDISQLQPALKHRPASNCVVFHPHHSSSLAQEKSITNFSSKNSKCNNQQYETVKSLTRELKSKDKELQEYIEQIVRMEQEHETELQLIDKEYEDQLARMHELLAEQVQKNKQLQDKANMIRALGLDNSEDSSLLLGDL